jgi:hypothetical protein
MIAVARVATDVGGVRLEAAYAVTASPARCDLRGVNAPTAKTTSGMKAAATLETATAATMETATAATMKTTTTTTATPRLGDVCEREPQDCARQDPNERQRDLFAAPSSQHFFLYLNRRRFGRLTANTLCHAYATWALRAAIGGVQNDCATPTFAALYVSFPSTDILSYRKPVDCCTHQLSARLAR